MTTGARSQLFLPFPGGFPGFLSFVIGRFSVEAAALEFKGLLEFTDSLVVAANHATPLTDVRPIRGLRLFVATGGAFVGLRTFFSLNRRQRQLHRINAANQAFISKFFQQLVRLGLRKMFSEHHRLIAKNTVNGILNFCRTTFE